MGSGRGEEIWCSVCRREGFLLTRVKWRVNGACVLVRRRSSSRRRKKYLVKSTALVRTYEEVRDAIVNGYPVTVASNRGFQMRGRVDKGSFGVSLGIMGASDGVCRCG